jgi:Thiol-disulfide isomerase and thioredoxins
MKLTNKALFTLLFHLLLFMIYGQENQYRLKGVIDNRFNEHPIMLFAFNEDSILRVDTTEVIAGTFSFAGQESLKDIGVITIGNYPDTVVSQIVILDRGDIEVDMDKGRVKGTPLNDLYQAHLDTMSVFGEELRKLSEEAGDADRVETGSPRHKKLVEEGKYMVGFKSQNIHNIVGQYFFEQEAGRYFAEIFAYPPSETCADSAFYIVYNLADSVYKHREWVQDYIQRLEYRVKLIQQEKLKKGKPYSDFILTDQEGKDKSISDYIGQSRYTMLEFWASWCGPCIAAFPILKESYEKYDRADFEIVGISIDSSISAWKKGLEKVDVPWIQLWGRGSELEEEIMKAYAFKGIPFSVLIDNEGNIVESGNSELVIRYLDQIIN